MKDTGPQAQQGSGGTSPATANTQTDSKPIVELGERRRVAQWDILNKAVKQRHIEGMIIFRGPAASRPTNTPNVTEVLAYWATNTGVLSIWSGTQWLTTTLT